MCWDTIDNGACDTMWWPNGGLTSRVLENLAPGTTYYWQVKADTPGGSVEANDGLWWHFTVSGEAPAALLSFAGPRAPRGGPGALAATAVSAPGRGATPSPGAAGPSTIVLFLVEAGFGLALVLGGPRRRRRGRLSGALPIARPAALAVVPLLLLWPERAAAQSGQVVEYYHTDAVGSVRAVTKVVNGQVQVVSRHDFMPFGEEVNPPNPPTEKRLFTGQERDFETGLDYFNARQLATGRGRFTAVDPAGGRSSDPQQWNRYSYVRNNPFRFVDPTGLYIKFPSPFPSGGSGTKEDPFTESITVVGTAGEMDTIPLWSVAAFFGGGDGIVSGGTGEGPGGGGGGAGSTGTPSTRGRSPSLNCSPGFPRAGVVDYLAGAASAAVMLGEFVTGLGPTTLTFGRNSAESRLMASSPGVANAVADYLASGKAKGVADFGLRGLLVANVNPVQQFAGSYSYQVTQASGGLNVTLYNETSVWSGAYHTLPSHARSTFRPMGTTSQYYQVFVPCR